MTRGLSLNYYDKILVGIAASLVGGSALGAATDYSFRVGLLVGALLATLLIYDAMFRHPPRPAPSARAKTAAFVWHVFLALLLLPSVL